MTADSLPIDPATTAVVVVDAQKAFTHDDGTPVRKGLDNTAAKRRLPAIRDLVEVARRHDCTVAYTRSVRRPDGRDAPQHTYDVVPAVYRDSEPSCVAGTLDVEYAEGIDPRPDEFEVSKVRYDAFTGTPLEHYLRSEGVSTVVLCGFSTNVCVESTARSAHERGFDVVAVSDCCAAGTAEAHEAALANVDRVLGAAVTSDELAAALAG
ncbi:cysteine hydrolase family protein [Halobacteriales archaeon Cl-PHB]